MTFFPDMTAAHEDTATIEPFMALIDEYGQETPITELDIRRSLKQLTEVEDQTPESLDSLMERVLAARAIA